MPLATEFVRVDLTSTDKVVFPLIAWPHWITWQTKNILSLLLGRVVTYNEELPLIKLLDPSIMWAFEIKRQIKHLISSLAQD